MAIKKTAAADQRDVPLTLPRIGHSRFSGIKPFIPVCAETWRKLCLAGKAPRPIKLSKRCTVYSNEEIHRWLADPIGYRAAPETQKAA